MGLAQDMQERVYALQLIQLHKPVENIISILLMYWKVMQLLLVVSGILHLKLFFMIC